ncbi:hypothetical protein TRICI_000578 [Trichomonascus ciferrii]|uniref:Uncharacterized protein n=1 Tax=Trichomonascus ciferrii TaxID=44093 RepID=A0A642VD33_9ASCO|nr:hypothetical protein TRICI_000578 [Trichomonascus ciferrii]
MPAKGSEGVEGETRIDVPDKTVRGFLVATEMEVPEKKRVGVVVDALSDRVKKLLGERRLRKLSWTELKDEVERLTVMEESEVMLLWVNPEYKFKPSTSGHNVALTWSQIVEYVQHFLSLREAVAYSFKVFGSYDNRLCAHHDEHCRFHVMMAASKGRGKDFLRALLTPTYTDPVAELYDSVLTQQLDVTDFENLKKLVISLKVNEKRVSVKRRFVIFSEAIEKYTMHGSSYDVDMDFFRRMTFSLLPFELRCLVGQTLFADEGFCFKRRPELDSPPKPTPAEDRISYWNLAHQCVNAISGWMPDEQLEAQFKKVQSRAECSELVEYLAQYDTIYNRKTFEIFLPNFRYLTNGLLSQKKLSEHDKWVCLLLKLAKPVRRVTEAKIHASNKENMLDESTLFQDIADSLGYYIQLEEVDKVHAKLIAMNEVDKFQWNAPLAKAFDPKKYL